MISIILDYSRQIKIYKTLCIALDTIFHHEPSKHICNFETCIAIGQNIVTLFYYKSLYFELLNWVIIRGLTKILAEIISFEKYGLQIHLLIKN